MTVIDDIVGAPSSGPVLPPPASGPTTDIDRPGRIARLASRSTRLTALRTAAGVLDRRLADPRVPLTLTLLLALLGTSNSWYVAVPVVILAVVGLVLPRVTAKPTFWLTLAATLGAAAWQGRLQVDNHQFLIAYWCLALAVAAASPDPVAVRRLAARVLVAAVFVLATFWKLLSPDFVDGSFMRYTLLTDARFSEVATLVGGVEPQALADNRARSEALGRSDGPLAPVPLHGSARIDVLAKALAGWTLLVEGAVAVAFAVPWRRVARHRDALLMTFVATTYAIAPVVGFGWVLVCLGLAQHDRERRGVRLGYLGCFLLVQAFTAPWPSIAGLMP